MNKRDINVFIDYVEQLWEPQNVKVTRADDYGHIYEIETPYSIMKIFIMPDGFSGVHNSIRLFPNETARQITGDRDAKTLAFYFNREDAVKRGLTS